jgi:hypothetical protein
VAIFFKKLNNVQDLLAIFTIATTSSCKKTNAKTKHDDKFEVHHLQQID